MICLFEQLVSVSKVTHDADQPKVGLNLGVGFGVHFAQADHICVYCCEVLSVES